MRMKKIFVISAIAALLLSSNFKVLADEPAYIDLGKVMDNYNKAQELAADLKVKEAELQKLVADAKKDIKLASVSDQKKLEDKYNKELRDKQDLYKQQYLSEIQDVQNNIQNAVKTVAKSKNVNVIYSKNSIILGGEDLTDDVVTLLKDQDQEKPDAKDQEKPPTSEPAK